MRITNDEVLNKIFQNAEVEEKDLNEFGGAVGKESLFSLLKFGSQKRAKEVEMLPFMELLFYFTDKIPATPRYLYDTDAVYFYNFDESISCIEDKYIKQDAAERGDVMMSFWMPFTFFLGHNLRGIISKDNANIEMILGEIKKGDKRVSHVCSIMNYFTKNYMTRGNLLLLPDMKNESGMRKMNPDRGTKYQDKMDQTLWHCFNNDIEKGGLSTYFMNDNNHVIEWIKKEHLDCMFHEDFFNYSLEEIETGRIIFKERDIELNRGTLQPLVPGKNIGDYNFNSFSDNDWNVFFDRINKVIAYRNNVKFQSYLPLEWKN